VKELIQHEMTSGNIAAELKKILLDETYAGKMKDNYYQLHQMLTSKGNPSEEAAKLVVNIIGKKAG
jgi:lipid A disaccharide synthetase